MRIEASTIGYMRTRACAVKCHEAHVGAMTPEAREEFDKQCAEETGRRKSKALLERRGPTPPAPEGMTCRACGTDRSVRMYRADRGKYYWNVRTRACASSATKCTVGAMTPEAREEFDKQCAEAAGRRKSKALDGASRADAAGAGGHDVPSVRDGQKRAEVPCESRQVLLDTSAHAHVRQVPQSVPRRHDAARARRVPARVRREEPRSEDTYHTRKLSVWLSTLLARAALAPHSPARDDHRPSRARQRRPEE
jgi:general stress protein YciG